MVREFKIRNVIWLRPEIMMAIRNVLVNEPIEIAYNTFISEAVEYLLEREDLIDDFLKYLKNKYNAKDRNIRLKCPLCNYKAIAKSEFEAKMMMEDHLKQHFKKVR